MGVGRHALFQGIFLTEGSNPGLLHCRQILLINMYSEVSLLCIFGLLEGFPKILSARSYVLTPLDFVFLFLP